MGKEDNTGFKRKHISVVVPVYNSVLILPELCQRLQAVLNDMCGANYEIILVDDCSTDGVWNEIKKQAANNAAIKGYRMGNNFGQWMATLAGVKQSTGDYIVTIDDDLEYDPADIKQLYNELNSNDYYLVFGIAPDKYHVKNVEKLTARFRNRIINFLWQKFLTDSFKIFKRAVLFDNNEFAPRVHFEAFVKHNLNQRFVGYSEVKYLKRYAGSSNHTLGKKILIFLRYSIEYYRTPIIGIAFFTYLFFGLSIVMEYLIFHGSLNGLLNTLIGLTVISLSLVLLHYISRIYWAVRKLPDYWVVETTERHE